MCLNTNSVANKNRNYLKLLFVVGDHELVFRMQLVVCVVCQECISRAKWLQEPRVGYGGPFQQITRHVSFDAVQALVSNRVFGCLIAGTRR